MHTQSTESKGYGYSLTKLATIYSKCDEREKTKMKKAIASILILTVIGTVLTGCGDSDTPADHMESIIFTDHSSAASTDDASERSSEKQDSSTENGTDIKHTQDDNQTQFDSYETALKCYIDYLNDNDYDAAIKLMFPESYGRMLQYTIENDDELEDIKSVFEDFWDEEHPKIFKEIVSEEPIDDSDREYFSSMISQLLYCADYFSEYYTQNDSYEQFCDEMNDLLYEMRYNIQSYPNVVTDYHRINFVLTDKHDIDFDYAADVYLIGGEGWRIANVEEIDNENWSKNILPVSANAEDIYVAAKYALLSAIADHVNETGEKGFTEPCIISPNPNYCYHIENETAEKICSMIDEMVDDTDRLNYFIGVVDGEVADLIICFKDNINVVCSYPTGIIQCGEAEDDYENASALNFDEAYRLYLENLEAYK